MKLFKKMAVLAAALMLVSVFVSCDNNTEESSDAAVIAEFNGYANAKELPPEGIEILGSRAAKVEDPDVKVTFYDDDTFKVMSILKKKAVDEPEPRAADTAEVMNGTYEGDPSKDGKVKVTVENMMGDSGKLEPLPDNLPDYLKNMYNTTIEIKEDEFDYQIFHFVRVEEQFLE